MENQFAEGAKDEEGEDTANQINQRQRRACHL